VNSKLSEKVLHCRNGLESGFGVDLAWQKET
jgi:hypothetical protein